MLGLSVTSPQDIRFVPQPLFIVMVDNVFLTAGLMIVSLLDSESPVLVICGQVCYVSLSLGSLEVKAVHCPKCGRSPLTIDLMDRCHDTSHILVLGPYVLA